MSIIATIGIATIVSMVATVLTNLVMNNNNDDVNEINDIARHYVYRVYPRPTIEQVSPITDSNPLSIPTDGELQRLTNHEITPEDEPPYDEIKSCQ